MKWNIYILSKMLFLSVNNHCDPSGPCLELFSLKLVGNFAPCICADIDNLAGRHGNRWQVNSNRTCNTRQQQSQMRVSDWHRI